MNVFITWSGERSHAVAKILHDWLPDVIQRVEPFLSSEEIAKGANWGHEITKYLRLCPVGIVCLTPENLTAPWLLFEAGAISNNVEILSTKDGAEVGQPKACTYLYELTSTDVKKPLEIFQNTIAKNRDENRKLLTTINDSLGKEKLEVQKLDRAFETYWPDLEKKLNAIQKPKSTATSPPKRDTDDILLEVLTEVRNLSKVIESTNRVPLSNRGLGWFALKDNIRHLDEKALLDYLLLDVKNDPDMGRKIRLLLEGMTGRKQADHDKKPDDDEKPTL